MEHPNSIRELFEQLANNQILLPDFQREYVWNLEKQKSLLASLLVNLSIGSLLMINGKSNDFLSKEIGLVLAILQTICYDSRAVLQTIQ